MFLVVRSNRGECTERSWIARGTGLHSNADLNNRNVHEGEVARENFLPSPVNPSSALRRAM